jgi:hypothetical protein
MSPKIGRVPFEMLDNVRCIYEFLNGGLALDAELAAYKLEAMVQKDRIRSV